MSSSLHGARRAALGVLAAGIVAVIWAGASAARQVPAPETAPIPAPLDALSPSSIAVGNHGCALPGDGTVRCWGRNYSGQLGNGLQTDPSEPAGDELPPPVTVIAGPDSSSPLSGVRAVAVGEAHTCALLVDGGVKCWGANAAVPDGGPIGPPARSGGQLGDGTTTVRLAPVSVIGGPGDSSPLTDAAAIAAGGDYTCALMADTTIKCWGNAPQAAGLAPVTVMKDATSPLSNVVAITAGDHHACALLATGSVECWGVNHWGQLGDDIGDTSAYPVPVTIGGEGGAALTGVATIAASFGYAVGPNGFAAGHTCALLVDGGVVCWGVNDVSQLGNGTVGEFEGQPWAGPVISAAGASDPLSGVSAISSGYAHTCGLMADATVRCWGMGFGDPPGNPGGFEGNGAPVPILGPDGASPLADVVAISGTCAVLGDGSVWCWPGSDQASYVVPGLLISEPAATPAPAATTAPAPTPASTAAAGTTPPPVVSSAPAGGGPEASEAPDLVPAVRFRESVPTPAEIPVDPVILAQSVAIAAAIVLFVPFPGVLFNSTLEANYPEITERARGARRRLGALFAFVPWRERRSRIPVVSQSPPDADSASASVTTEAASRNHAKAEFWTTLHGITLFLGLTALLGSFLDPTFGPDTQSLATFIGLVVGLVVTIAAFGVPVVFTFRRSAVPFLIRALPGTLLVGLACVLISRLTDFQPGYLYGLVIGVAARELSVAAAPRTVAVATATTLITAFVAWFAMLWVGPLASATDAGFVIAVVQTALATTLVAGLEGVFFGMLPIRFLPGETVFRWNRKVWAALFGTATIGFLLVLMNPASGYLADGTRTPMFTILGLLLGFGIGSVAFWAYFRFRHPPTVASAAS